MEPGDNSNIVENTDFTQACKIVWDSLLDKPKPVPKLFDLVIDSIKANQINYNPEDIPNECHIAIQSANTTLKEALIDEKWEIVYYLLDNNKCTESEKNDQIMNAINVRDSLAIKILFKYGVTISKEELLIAAARVNTDYVNFFLDQGADIHAKEDEALVVACSSKNLDIVRLLVKRGANIKAQNDKALRWSRSCDIIAFLLDHGANIHVCDDTVFQGAAIGGDLELTQLLIERGANIHTTGELSLRYASASGHVDVVRLLLEHGAQVDIFQNEPIKWAADYNRVEVVKLLLENGADIRVINKERMVQKGHTEIVQLIDRQTT